MNIQLANRTLAEAKKILYAKGFDEKRIKTYNDLLQETRNDDFGMIFMGRRGVSAVREFFLEYSVSKIIQSSGGVAVWFA